jgi:hypothetical protein
MTVLKGIMKLLKMLMGLPNSSGRRRVISDRDLQLNIDQGTNGIVIGEPASGIAPYDKSNMSPSNTFYNDQANLAVMVEQSGGYSSASDSLAKDKPDTPNYQQPDKKTRVKSKK